MSHQFSPRLAGLAAAALLAGALAPSAILAAPPAAPPHHGAIVRHADLLTVRDAWAHPATETGVAYFTIRNASNRPLELIGVSTSRAARASLHESYAAHAPHEHAGGMLMTTAMRPLKSVVVPARGAVTFKPGGRHVMLDGLRGELHRGQTFALTLRFAGGLEKVVAVQVR